MSHLWSPRAMICPTAAPGGHRSSPVSTTPSGESIAITKIGSLPPVKLRRAFSTFRFESENCGIEAIPRDFQGDAGGFLRTVDCVARGE